MSVSTLLKINYLLEKSNDKSGIGIKVWSNEGEVTVVNKNKAVT